MATYQFKTNIKCGGCIAAVTPHFTAERGITTWQVDLQHPDRILTLDSPLTAKEVQEVIKEAGYSAELKA